MWQRKREILEQQGREIAALTGRILELESTMRAQSETIVGLEEEKNSLARQQARLSEELRACRETISEIEAGRKADGEHAKSEFDALKESVFSNQYQKDIDVVDLEMALCEQVYPENRERYARLKESHPGETCFIIGNGPSLRAQDLTAIHRAGVFSFATNRIYRIFDQTEWRPDLFVCADTLILKQSQMEINQKIPFLKLFPASAYAEYGIRMEKNVIYFPFRYRNTPPVWISPDFSRVLHEGMTVTFLCMQLAFFMGFQRIFLLGVDHNYPVRTQPDGSVVVDSTRQAYFSSDYLKKDETIYLPHMEDMQQAYYEARHYGQTHGIEILNATRGGALEVFPRVEFDTLLQEEK